MAVYTCNICGEKYEYDERPKECAVCGGTEFRLEESTPLNETRCETDAGDSGYLYAEQNMAVPPVKVDQEPKPACREQEKEGMVKAWQEPKPAREEQEKEGKMKAWQEPETAHGEQGKKGKMKAGGVLGAVILITLGGLVLHFKYRLIPFLYGQLGLGRIFRKVYPETVLISAGVLLIGCGVMLAVIWLVGFLKYRRKAQV